MSSAAMRRASISQAGDDSHVDDDSLKMLQGAKRAASKLCLVQSLCDVCDQIGWCSMPIDSRIVE
jgi:hypothetical protein